MLVLLVHGGCTHSDGDGCMMEVFVKAILLLLLVLGRWMRSGVVRTRQKEFREGPLCYNENVVLKRLQQLTL